MLFWVLFVSVCLGLFLIEDLTEIRFKKYVHWLVASILVIVGGFRYRIGWDYDAYVHYFETSDVNDLYPEITLRYLIHYLREINFDYQAIFLIYSILTIFFLWMGIKYFTKPHYRILSLLIYAYLPNMFWGSFSTIRQALAMAIVFWGMKYLVDKALIKYCVVIISAAFIHESSLLMLPLYFFINRIFPRYVHLTMVLAAIFCVVTGLHLKIIEYCVNLLNLTNALYYINWGAHKSTFITILDWLFFVIWLLIIGLKHKIIRNEQDELVINLTTLGIIINLLTDFSGQLNRFVWYFDIFRIALLPIWILSFAKMYRRLTRYILVLSFACIFLLALYRVTQSVEAINHDDFSAGNIEYEFNFQLFK